MRVSVCCFFLPCCSAAVIYLIYDSVCMEKTVHILFCRILKRGCGAAVATPTHAPAAPNVGRTKNKNMLNVEFNWYTKSQKNASVFDVPFQHRGSDAFLLLSFPLALINVTNHHRSFTASHVCKRAWLCVCIACMARACYGMARHENRHWERITFRNTCPYAEPW